MLLKIGIIFLLLINLPVILMAQIGTGNWRDHLCYRNGKMVMEIDEKIYCLTTGGIFYFNKEDYSINKYTRIEGLSDLNPTAFAYSDIYKTIIIGYKNGNIDIIEGKIHNIPFLKLKTMAGQKTIHNITLYDKFAYLSTDFGIVVVDIIKKEIKDSYIFSTGSTTLKVNDVAIYNDSIYAATSMGLYKGALQNINLLDFGNWKKYEMFPGFALSANQAEVFNNDLIISYSDNNTHSLYRKNGNQWTEISELSGTAIHSINISRNKLLICSSSGLYVLNNQYKTENQITHYQTDKALPINALIDKQNLLWIADYDNSLVFYNPPKGIHYYYPKGPYYNSNWDLAIKQGKLYVSGGGFDETGGNFWRSGQVHLFENEEWYSFFDYSGTDIVSIAIDPLKPENFYSGSWGNGVSVWNKNQVVQTYGYRESNHPLVNVINGEPYVRISGIALDAGKNLWVVNTGVSNLLSVLQNNGTWVTFPLGSIYKPFRTRGIIIDKNNNKWIALGNNEGLLVFNENKTIDNPEDDKHSKFMIISDKGEIKNSDVQSLAEDKNGNIWVGTMEGVCVYYSPENVFSGKNFYASTILVPRNDGTNNADELLKTTVVSAIAIDGANRKWFGTKGAGVFLFSEDGTYQILHFNTDNSPILSNFIIDIEIDGKTGEVFFSTSAGLCSYKGNAAEENEQKDMVYVYPNPVRENYSGPITITGLFANSTVKITDITGNIIFETKTEGSQATWNGKDTKGQRVATGVYLVFCSNNDGSKTRMAKFMIIH